MKTISSFMMALVAIAFFAACGNAQKNAATDAHDGHDHAPGEGHGAPTANVQPSASAGLKDDLLNTVYQHYIHLTNALVNSDMAEAKIAANAVELGAKQLANGTALAALATKIAMANDIEVQRTVYAALSNDLIARAKASGVKSGEIYIEYCPMALNDKGASWLSNQKEIKNPYFGESMMACGEVKEILK